MKRLLLCALLVSACGTTVPVTEQVRGAQVAPVVEQPSAAPSGAGASTTRPQAVPPPGAAPTREAVATGPTTPLPARRIRTPLTIGFTYAETGATAVALGADDGSVNGRTTGAALVRALNLAGGLNGRAVRTVTYGWDTSGGSYSAAASEACQRFTRDNQVEVVLDSVFGTIGGFAACLQKAGVLHLTSTTEGDAVSSRARTLHANTQVMVDERTYGTVVRQLHAVRYLAARNRLGIVLEECANQVAALRTVERLVRSLGLAAPVVRRIGCTTGFASAGAAASAIGSAILAFRDAGVDRVMMMSDYETVALLLFANAAGSQGYRPGYLLSSNAQAEATRGSLPQDQWPQLRGVGVSPGGDVSLQGRPFTAVEQRCLGLARRGGLQPVTQNEKQVVLLQCGLFVLLEAALDRTRGSSRPADLMAAISGLGSSLAVPALVGGRTRFGAGRLDGPAQAQEFAYVPACSCLRYRGPLIDV